MLVTGYYSIVYILISLVSMSNSARILAFYPTPSFSHQVVFRPLTNELVERGHQVTVVTTDPQYPKGQSPDNLAEVDVHDLSYEVWREHFVMVDPTKLFGVKDGMEVIMTNMAKVIEQQFRHADVQNVITSRNTYDLLIVEAYSRPLLILSHIFKIPVILFSSMGLILDNYQQLGAPQNELLYPTVMRHEVYNLTARDIINELYTYNDLLIFYNTFEDQENSMLKRVFGDDIPPINELANNIDLSFVYTHPIFEGIRPMPPNVIQLNKIYKKPIKDLPAELKYYLDSSKNGVIYISFGTNIQPSLLPPDTLEKMKKVLAKLPYDVLWKWDLDMMTHKPENVKILKWVPQTDLLRHPKIKLFVTQGGLQSTDEAIEAGIPLLGIPIFADQWFNVAQSVYHKIGLRLVMEHLTEENFNATINEIIADDSYRQNIARLRSLMNDHPEGPLERAIQWTEFLLRNGGTRYLRSPAANMPWMQFYEVELISIILLSLSVPFGIFFAVVIYSAYRLYKRIFKR